MRVFHKVMNKTWSSVPTQWGIEAEKSGAWRHMQEVKWCWHSPSPIQPEVVKQQWNLEDN